MKNETIKIIELALHCSLKSRHELRNIAIMNDNEEARKKHEEEIENTKLAIREFESLVAQEKFLKCFDTKEVLRHES